MAVLIRNRTGSPFTLPAPLTGVLAAGQGIVLNSTEAVVRSLAGPFPKGILITDVPQSSNFDTQYEGELLSPEVEAGELGTGAVTEAKIATGAVTADKLGTGAVTGVKLAAGTIRTNVVAGQDETGDTTIPVTDIADGDELLSVLVLSLTTGLNQRALTDFTIGAGVVNVVANAADNALNQYLIQWIDKTA